MNKRFFLASIAALCCFINAAVWAAKPLVADTLKPFLDEQITVMLGANCQTRLEIIPSRKTDEGRAVSVLRFTVAPAQAFKGFDFDFFEGPGAPALRSKPLKVNVRRGGKATSSTLAVAGYRGGNIEDGFVFEAVGSDNGGADAITAILGQIAQGADSVDIAVSSGKSGAPVLGTRFTVRK